MSRVCAVLARTREIGEREEGHAAAVVRAAGTGAAAAVEHSILIAVWHMLTNDVDDADLGGDYFARLDPQRAMRRIVRQPNALGFTIRFDLIQVA